MTMENSGPGNKTISSIDDIDKATLFERVVSTKNGIETIRLSDLEIETITNDLMENKELVGLVKNYRVGLENPAGFSETGEVSLRQRIFPLIDAKMQEINPAFSIFSVGILEIILAKVGKQD